MPSAVTPVAEQTKSRVKGKGNGVPQGKARVTRMEL
jgi:hypothetical protein